MATNDLYQSTFMPIFQKAETKIKLLVLVAFLYAENLTILRNKIKGVVIWVDKQIPKTLNDRKAYINGLIASSERYIALYYKKPQKAFTEAKRAVLDSVPKDKKAPVIKNPQQLNEVIKSDNSMWKEAKATPNVINYKEKLKQTYNKLAEDQATTFDPNKKAISLWQKAELDVRYEGQMQMLQDLREQGVQYAWISSHPDCSKRCEKWQGKLMDLNAHAKGSNYQVTTLDGHPVFSLVDIMDKTDKYGYKNNVICGFNCRHHLIPYKSGEYGPKQYTEKDVAKQRQIEENIRLMERKIRHLKELALIQEQAGEIKIAKSIKNRVKILVSKYKAFCEKHGYAWNDYRINVW